MAVADWATRSLMPGLPIRFCRSSSPPSSTSISQYLFAVMFNVKNVLLIDESINVGSKLAKSNQNNGEERTLDGIVRAAFLYNYSLQIIVKQIYKSTQYFGRIIKKGIQAWNVPQILFVGRFERKIVQATRSFKMVVFSNMAANRLGKFNFFHRHSLSCTVTKVLVSFHAI